MTDYDAWPESIRIVPVQGPLDGEVCPPGSKSISNRALLLAALASGESHLTGIADCEDTRLMAAALKECGATIEENWEPGPLVVSGIPNSWMTTARPQSPTGLTELFVGNSGTTIRFLTAALTARGGGYRLSGVPRMHERPIGDLLDALVELGGNVLSEATPGYPPVIIQSIGLRGGSVTIRGDRSSQFLSGLMMAAPLAREPVTIELPDTLVSRPYVDMTAALMRSFGCTIEATEDGKHFTIAPQIYRSTNFLVEPDASAASYFFAAAAICGGNVRVLGLGRQSLQGDIRFVDCLERMGSQVTWANDSVTVSGKAQRGIDCDMSEISDTVQTLAVVALFVNGPTRIRGVAHNRFKETDRIGNLATELRKLGAVVTEHDDGLTIEPISSDRGQRELDSTSLGASPIAPSSGMLRLETWNDHRMAMSLALAGLRRPGIEIVNPGCVVKTYPRYFEDLERLITSKP